MAGLDPGDFSGNERFLVQERLGAGGYGVVYRAYDRERNAPVAIKTLRHMAAKALLRFKQEFRALADVSHPNLVTLYELSSHDGQWFFTMELVDGVGFLWYVRGDTYPPPSGSTSRVSPLRPDDGPLITPNSDAALDGPVDMDRLRRTLPQLAEGVVALHEAGKLHRDIKPSNVLVTREGRVVVLDFGLVAELEPVSTETVDLVGTPAYMSPEQAAGLPLTPASDWYNVGAMLYQALTGVLPFSGPAKEVLRLKQECEPAPPRDVAPDVPRDLDALCRDLLRRDPRQRPAGRDVIESLKSARTASPAPAPSVAPGAAHFVGRESQLAALRDAFRAVQEGREVIVAVHGGSGMGKTALVRRFLEELKDREPETVILAGRCYERESVPYKALDALVDALSHYLRHQPSSQAEAFLPHDILALAKVFPVLRQVSAVNRARRAVLEIPDSLELRRRAFGALRELLVRVADRRRLVLFIDDLQWGDVDSGALLEWLVRPPDPPTLLLIGCYRSEEAKTAPLLRSILPKRPTDGSLDMRDVVVAELPPAEARDLARALVGAAHGDRRAETLAAESRGNPYFIEELVRFSQAGGARTASDVTFDQVIAARVASLPESARRLLDAVAVSGVPIEPGVAYRAADLEGEGESAQAALRAAHLVRARGAAGRQDIETYHDRIRDAVVASLPPEALRDWHHRLASALLATGRADPEMLATHYLGAGDAATAAEFAVQAAAKASAALAFDRSAGLYRFALDLTAGPDERARLEVQLADAVANAGRGAEAAAIYLSAAERAGPALSIDLHHRAAQQLFVSGHIEEAGEALAVVLAKVGIRRPESHRWALVSLLARRAYLRLRGLRFKERDETQVAAQDLLRIDTCWSVGAGMGNVDMVSGADFQARHLLLALRAGEPYRVARALALESAYVAMGGSRSRERATRLRRASRQLARRVDRPYSLALATLTTGIAAWLDGRWREARELCESGEATLRERCTGVDWELLTAQLFSLASLFFLGEIGELSNRRRLLLDDAEGRGNLLRATFLRAGFCCHIARLAADAPQRARDELEAGLAGWKRGERFDYLHLWVRGARTDISLYSGERLAAPEPVRATWQAAARALDRFVQAGFVRGLDARGRRRLALAAQATDAGERRVHVRSAEEHARTIEREKTRWGDPLALLIRAAAAASRGETEQAVVWLGSAEAGLQAAEMALHAAVARRRRGELLGGETGRALVDSADAWMAGQSIRNPERMTAMLAPGPWGAGT